MAKQIKYVGQTGLTALVAKVKTLVNAVQESAASAMASAQTASTEANFYGTCATAAATVAKVVTCANYVLKTGAKVAVKFTAVNTAATATLDINGTGAKNVLWVGSTTTTNAWSANETVLFVYDGASYHLLKSINAPAITPISNGGTGASTAEAALANLGASPAGHKHAAADITSGIVPLANGGTGASTAAAALSAIGAAALNHSHTAAAIGAAAANHNHAATDINSGILAVANGGTGANTVGGILSAIGGAPASHNHDASSIVSGTMPIARGGTGGASADAACAALGAAKRILYNATIDTSWTANGATGFYKTVNIAGILASDVPVVGVVLSSDVASAKLQGAAFACVNRIVTNNGSITLYAFGTAPKTTVSIQLLVLR